MLRNIEIIETKEKVSTLKVNNKFLHSKYYPIKDAKTFIENNSKVYKDKKHVLVYGIGLGYHIKELLNHIEKDCSIYVFDADEDIVKIANELRLLEEIYEDGRINLFIGYSKDFIDNFYEKLQLVDDILIHNPSIDVLPNTIEDFKLSLKSFSISKSGIANFAKLAKENYENNISVKHKSIEEFYDINNFRDEPVIIVSSGPSLDFNVKHLNDFKGKAKIFAAGSSLKTLIDNNIMPDMICIIDAHEIIANQIKGYEDLSVPLCYLSTASHEAVSSYNGPKFIFYNTPHENSMTIDTGKSVATAILDIAINGGADTIIFVGQDLAYVDNKTHAEAYSEVHKADISIPITKQYKTVQGVNGELLNTNTSLLYFKQWIENKISEHPDITFINCSKGAKIKGTIDMKLEDL